MSNVEGKTIYLFYTLSQSDMNNKNVTISKKQLEANKTNALKWGVKTPEWKEKVKFNAIKHWLSSNLYDEDLENTLIEEYRINWTLEKMLIKNTCIAKARYEKWVELEHKFLQNIISPPKFEKVYNSQEEYENYIIEKKRANEMFDIDILWPAEPSYTMQKVEWNAFDYDTEKIEYLINIIWKYNYQNEVRLNKNITSLLWVVKG